LIPSGTELARPFLPAKDFDVSRKFYETLGFEKLLDSEVAIFRMGSSQFILQRYHQKAQTSCCNSWWMDDLDAWWKHIEGLDLAAAFGVPPPRAPAMQPWGLRVAYVVDPSGVLWHVAERRPGVRHD
jgi:catechol 2,3-dioxygenase-like lactoylglutathione lyase family enzyme